MADNILEYVLSLKDKVSANLQIIGVNNDTALDKFSKLELQASKVSREMTDLGKNAYTLGQKLALLKNERDLIDASDITSIKKYNSEIKQLETEISNIQNATGKGRIAGWFSDAFQSIPFAGLLTNPLVVAGSVAGKALSVGMEADLNKTAFSVMLNSDDAADQLITSLKGIKMDQGALGESAKTMLGFGVATEKVVPMLDAIGNIAGGDSAKVSSLSLAFSQMSSTGKLMGQDLLQMINAGFNPLAEIARTTGRDLGELKDEMAKGNITVEMVEEAFKSATGEGGSFNGMLDKMNNTLSGKIQNAMMKVNELLLQLYTVLEPIVSFSLDVLVGLFNAVTESVDWFVNGLSELNPLATTLGIIIGSLITGMAAYIVKTKAQTTWSKIQVAGQKLQVLWTNLTSAAWWKLNAAMLANPIVWIVAGIVALIGVIVFLITKVEGWGEAWGHAWNGAKLVVLTFVEKIKFGFNTMINGIMIGINKIKEGWYRFKNAVGLGDEKENNKMIAQINGDTNRRMKEIIDGAKKVKDLENQSLNEFGSAIGSLKIKKGKDKVDEASGVSTGIEPPKAPGASPADEKNGDNASSGQASKSNESIATGGQRNTVINITMKNMVEAMNITGRDFKESANNMSTELQDQMARVLAMAVTTAG